MNPFFAVPSDLRSFLAVLLVVAAGGCGGGGTVAANEEIAFLVGDWRATRFEVLNEADPSIALDLIADFDATFTIRVEPSGQYTAILTVQGAPFTEIGTLDLQGGQLVQQVQEPCCKTVRADYSLQAGILNLHGPTEFDFNQDGADEAAIADVDLVRD